MALINAEGNYLRIESITAGHDCFVNVALFKDSDTRFNFTEFDNAKRWAISPPTLLSYLIEEWTCTETLSVYNNAKTQAYRALKDMPEFADWDSD